MLRRSIRLLQSNQYLYITSRLKLHTSGFPVFYARFDKDLPNPTLPSPISKVYGHDTDILLDQLKTCKSIDRMLEVINMHLNVMNTKHIVTCIDHINNYIKNDKVLAQSLLNNPIFKSLCSRLMKVIRLFEPEEIISCYKLFCAMEVRSNTYIMQSVLKMLGAHLNNMSLGQLIFLSFLLHKQRHNALVDGLRLALPLVVQVQIDHQLDSDNMKNVVNSLQLCCRSRLKPAVIQKIVNVIAQKASMLSTDDAVTVAFSLMNIEVPIDGYKELLATSLDIISRNLLELNDKKIITILKTCRSRSIYHFKLFVAIADYIVSQKCNFDLTYLSLFHFYALDFSPSNLIDYFANVLCLESEQYQREIVYSPLNCIEYLTGTSYQCANIDGAVRVLCGDKTKLQIMKEKNPHLYLKFLSCLAILGHFPHDCLSEILEENFLFYAWQVSKKLGRALEFECNLLSLSWSFEIYNEGKKFIIPSSVLNKVIHNVYQKHTDAEYPLEKFFENGLGGSQFLKSGVFTEDGHVIDHVVALRNGNYPVSLQYMKPKERKEITLQNFMFVEDLILPDDTKIVAVVVAKEEHYFRDPEILRGWVDLKVRSLAKKNFATVVINYAVWSNLPDREKIPYLMREMKQVVVSDDFALSSNFR